jgi:hypothetical protein
VTVQENKAEGSWGTSALPTGTASGGGIFSDGALTVEGGTIRSNRAVGGLGNDGYATSSGRGATASPGVPGGGGLGGGVYVAGGTANLSGVTLAANTAEGGGGGNGARAGKLGRFKYRASSGGNGGDGQGGGLYAAGGTTTLTSCDVIGNMALGGAGGRSGGRGASAGADGEGKGGGLSIEADAVLILDLLTKRDTTGNTASTSETDPAIDPNIYGAYKVSDGG